MQRGRVRPLRAALLAGVVLSAALLGASLDHLLFAQQPGIKRTILLRADDPAAPATHEAVMAVAEIAPGASAGKHRHSGIELGYVLEGSVIVEREGQAPVTLIAGEAFKNDAGIHNAKNPGTKPVKILAVYLVEKGKPLAEPVPPAPTSRSMR